MRKVVFIFFLTTNLIAQEIKISNVQDLYEKGNVTLESSISKKTKVFFNDGLEIAKKLKNDSLIAKGNFYLGEYFYKSSQYLNAIDYFNESLLIYKKLKIYKKISICNRKLGDIYKKSSNFEKALFYYYESLKINEFVKNENQITRDLNIIGNLYSRTRDFKSAENRLKRALEIDRKNNNITGIVNNINTLGAVYQRTEKFDKAIEYYKEALVYADSLGLKRNQSILLGNIGSTSRSLEKYNQSLEYLFKALVLKKELKRNGSTAHTLIDISETYLHMSEFNNAKKYALEAIKYAKNESLELERYAYYILSKSNYGLEKFKESYDDLEKFTTLNDSIFNINKSKAINELNIRYDTEKRDLKIKAQESDIALLDEKNKVKNQWLLFGGIGLIGVFSFILLYRSRNTARKREQLQEQFSQELIKTQEDERTRVARELHDSVGQKLMLLTKKTKSSGDNDLESLAGNTLEELRSISRGLHPATIERLGVTAAITSMINEVDKNTNIFFTSEIENIDAKLSKDAALHLYRIIQEVLSNMVKHAEAKAAFITIETNDNEIKATVKDNGKGFELSKGSKKLQSLGMKTLMERAKIINSELTIESRINKGTLVQIITPIS